MVVSNIRCSEHFIGWLVCCGTSIIFILCQYLTYQMIMIVSKPVIMIRFVSFRIMVSKFHVPIILHCNEYILYICVAIYSDYIYPVDIKLGPLIIWLIQIQYKSTYQYYGYIYFPIANFPEAYMLILPWMEVPRLN